MKRTNFTLVELLVVIGIIGILAAMVIPAAGMARAAGKKTDCINNKGNLIKAMQFYANDNQTAFIYRGRKGGNNISYAEVLTGWDETNSKVKGYASAEILTCSLTKGKLEDYEKVTGMLNAADADKLTGNADPAGGWLSRKSDRGDKPKFSKTFGAFASSKDKETVIYAMEKMKSSASGLLIFADTFKRSTDSSAEPYWNFTPDEASNTNYYVTLIHGSQTVGAFADGHTEGMDPGRLKECPSEVKVFNNDNFEKDKNSTN